MPEAHAQIRSGSYIGNAAARSIAGLGFQPDVVILKGNDNTIRAIARTSTMTLSKGMVSAVAAASGLITSLDLDGFSLSADAQVNGLGVAYHWVAFRMVAGESKVGSYIGNGADDRNITGLGFSPAYVVVIPTSARPVYHRSSSMTGDDSFDFDNSFGDPNRIQALLADGFQVGSDPDVSESGFTYNYVAWKAIPGKMAAGAYVGNGLDNRSITGAGMRPDYVIVKRDGSSASNGAAQKPLSTGAATDQSLLFNMSNFQVDAIQALEPDGFQVGTQPRVNLAGETYYWVAFADECPQLATSETTSTVTVTAPGSFEMRFNSATGGSVDQFYDLAESPVRDAVHDLAGGITAQDGLFLDELVLAADGLNYRSDQGPGANASLLEATATRVRVRSESYFGLPASTTRMAGIRAVGDWSVYSSGRMALHWERRTTSAVDTTFQQLSLNLHQQGVAPLNGWAGFTQGGPLCLSSCTGPAGTDFVLLQNELPGARTDFLKILYQDWAAATESWGSGNVGQEWVEAGWNRSFADTIPADNTEAWNSLTYFKPTNFLSDLDLAVNSRRDDYRSPSAITITQGTRWADAAENTAAAGDFFNEAQAAYVFDNDPGTGLSFDIDGSAITRHTPFFKIRQWRSLQRSATVTLEGVGLVRDADYRADVKPVSRSHFVTKLAWHCTFESTTACTPGTGLDVGGAGDASNVGAILPGHYGNAADFNGDLDSATAGTAGSGDFSAVSGAVEFWYQPHYDHDDGVRYLIWYNQSGSAPNANCFFLEKNFNELRFIVRVNYADAGCTTPDGNSTDQFLTVPVAGYAWRAQDWVHIKTSWDVGGGPKKLRLFVNGLELAFSGTYTAPSSHGPTVFGGCAGFALCPGGANGNAFGLIDEPHIYTALDATTLDVSRPLAHAGLLADTREELADTTRNFQMAFQPADAQFRGRYLYVGSDAKFHGLNVELSTPGSGGGVLTWEYWDGAKWASLGTGGSFTDTTNSFRQSGSLYRTLDPPSWAPISVDGGPDLFYWRAYLNGAAYTTLPVERQIKTDILLFQYCRDVTTAAQTFVFGPPGSADLSISKTDSQTSAVPGQSVSYTITVTNDGPDTVTSLFVNDSVPADITGAVFTPSIGAYNSATGEWTGLNLAATQSITLTLSGTIDPFARVPLANTTTVSPPAGVTDSNGANDFASDSDTLDPSADVQLVKTDDIDPAPLGALVTYILTLTNAGVSGATSVTVQDPLPADMNLDSGSNAITTSQGNCSYDTGARTVNCTLGDLAPAAVATVRIKVWPANVGSFTNMATSSRFETDSAPGNDSEGETTLVEVSTIAVRFFTATSTNQRNVLTWVNPNLDYSSTEIRWSTVGFPTSVTDGTFLYNDNFGGAGGRFSIAHDTPPLTNGQTYYYAAFAHRSSAPFVSPGRFVTGRPFDHTSGPVKWAFSTGATALTAPTVGGAGVIATSNDRNLYAMKRGLDDDLIPPDSGEWPAGFKPIELGGAVQMRSPVVPLTALGPNPVVYLGAQDGKVYAVDAAQGGSVGFPWGPTAIGTMVQAAPAGIFSDFLGAFDHLLLGTRHATTPNAFVALNPFTGAFVNSYDNGGAGAGEIGVVNGMAAVDYGPPAPPRAYFTSYERTPGGSTNTLWAFELSATPTVFSMIWAKQLGNIDSSPVLRGGRVLVGSTQAGGKVHSFEALLGGDERMFVHNDGQVRGFIFPDRASPTGDIYFATDDLVWGLTEIAGVLANKFTGPISLPGGAKPSPVLFVPGGIHLYVGGSDAKLYEIDTLQASPVPKPVTLGDGLAVVGAPSLDRVYNLIHVGTEAGIFYAVQIPLP